MFETQAVAEVSLATVWLLGVSMGLTACTVTCLPFLGTWALGRASHPGEALRHTAAFLAGRVLTYALLAALAGAAGLGLARALGGNVGNAAIGLASILAGLWLVLRPQGRHTAPAPVVAVVKVHREKPRDHMPPLLLGATLSLTPCTPLASLLALSASAGSAPQGALMGLTFGLGAAVTPILVLVPLAGRVGRELLSGRAWLARWLVWASAAVLVILGLRRWWVLL